MSRLLEEFHTKISSQLKEQLKVANLHAVPRVKKIVVNTGIGRILQQNPKALDRLVETMAKITGQKPMVTRAKKAISGFKVREGQVVGLAVTLRHKRMYDFLDRLINVALPRTRDFRGLPRSGFDRRGNYNCAVQEVMVFPEAGESGIEGNFGMQVTIVTTANDDTSAYSLLKKFGFPFKD